MFFLDIPEFCPVKKTFFVSLCLCGSRLLCFLRPCLRGCRKRSGHIAGTGIVWNPSGRDSHLSGHSLPVRWVLHIPWTGWRRSLWSLVNMATSLSPFQHPWCRGCAVRIWPAPGWGWQWGVISGKLQRPGVHWEPWIPVWLSWAARAVDDMVILHKTRAKKTDGTKKHNYQFPLKQVH